MRELLRISALIFIAMMGWHCDEDPQDPVVDSRLASYFAAFEQDALEHEVTIDLSGMQIEGILTDLSDAGVSGQCVTRSDGSRRVQIDEAYWNGLDDLRREFIIYHELGHCALDRRHLDEAYDDGTCKSMMHSSSGTCFMMYGHQNRAGYLAELFRNANVAP